MPGQTRLVVGIGDHLHRCQIRPQPLDTLPGVRPAMEPQVEVLVIEPRTLHIDQQRSQRRVGELGIEVDRPGDNGVGVTVPAGPVPIPCRTAVNQCCSGCCR